jgi:hypothetical protein
MKKRKEQVTDRDDEQVLMRIRGILNKLTVEKFEKLYEELIGECGIETERHLDLLVAELFEKATTQHHFVGMYTALCKRLDQWHATRFPEDPKGFRKILLGQCQLAFERIVTLSKVATPLILGKSPDATAAKEEALEAEVKRKTAMLGSIKLLGRLLAESMVASRILITCADDLLHEPNAERLECLAALLTVAGPVFDNKVWQHRAAMAHIFTKVEAQAKDTRWSARARFLLKDVLDLRAIGWQDKKATRSEQ